MQRLRVVLSLLLIFLLAACTQRGSTTQASSTDSTPPHAAIVLRDGTMVTGVVTSTSPLQITLNMDSGGTRTILVKDVQSLQYGDTPAPVPSASSASTAIPAPSAVPASSPAALPATSPVEPAQNRAKPAPAPEPRNRPDESAVQTRTFVIPAGTPISVRNDVLIDSSEAAPGQTYPAEVTNDVRDAHGKVLIPRGARAQLVIISASKGGKIQGAADLVLAMKSVSIGGRQYVVQTTDIREQGKKGIGKNKRTGKFVGGGAAGGGILGAIVGGGKGFGIGALSGAVAGGAAQVLTKGKAVKVPAETLLTFRLEAPVRVVERAG
jgi:hypothetical protein